MNLGNHFAFTYIFYRIEEMLLGNKTAAFNDFRCFFLTFFPLAATKMTMVLGGRECVSKCGANVLIFLFVGVAPSDIAKLWLNAM